MQVKIIFQSMKRLEEVESYAEKKLAKIPEILTGSGWKKPVRIELILKAIEEKSEHRAKLHLKTPQFDLNTECQEHKIITSVDKVIDKMLRLLKKEKAKIIDKGQKVNTDKQIFTGDKYKKY